MGLTVFFVGAATADLDNFRPVSSDEVWIMSVSYKLATQSILGSDLYAGFLHTDQYYLMNLPAHHFLQAISFRLFGAGVAQARWASLASGVLIIWAVDWMAYRWYGLAVALLTGVLLVFWRSDLSAPYLGLPLLAAARSGRYDLSTVAWMWLSIGLLGKMLRSPGWMMALAVGVCAGLATLTQFFGAFILPVIAAAWFWHRGKRLFTAASSYWMATGFMLIVLPYVLYAVFNFAGLAGRIELSKDRVRFDRPEFYLNNIVHEPDRFATLAQQPAPVLLGPDSFDRPVGPWLLAIGIWPASVDLWRRVRRTSTVGDRILWLSLVAFEGLLALLEQTKAPLYAMVLFPSVCLMLAASWIGALRWVWKEGQRLAIRLIGGGLIMGLLAIVVLEGVRAYRIDQRQSGEVSNYLDVGRKIERSLVPGARVLGAERWWWALRDHPYLALNNVWAQWGLARQAGSPMPEFAEWVARTGTDFIIINDNVRGEIRRHPDVLQAQFWSFLDKCSALASEWTDGTYGKIEVYRVANTPPDSTICWR